MNWIAFDKPYVVGAMPTDVRVAYDAWVIANPAKSERLEEIVGQVRADFRAGLSANPNVEMDADSTLLLLRCVPHAMTCVLFLLLLEMGLVINMSAQTAYNNAQVYLRRLYTSDEAVDGAAVSRTPSYEVGVECGGRAITWM